MSIAPQALERSVLERKERDELAAIAEAMGVKPSSRASKAALIDQILKEAGIETGPSEKPKRSRSRSRSAGSAGAEATESGGSGGGNGEGATGDASGSPNGATTDVADESPAAATAAANDPAVTASAGNGEAAPAEGGGERATARQASETPSESPVSTEAGAATSEGRATEAGDGDGTGAGAQGGDAATATETKAGAADRSADGPGGRADRGGQGQGGGSRTDDRPRDRDRDNRDRGDRDRGDRDRGDRDRNRGGGHHEGNVEPGNRRSRRRRGRDRGDRDLQQDRGGPEVPFQGEPVPVDGLLDLRDEGYGFLRTNGYLPSPKDIYVSLSQVRRFALRRGDHIQGASRPAGSSEKYPALLRIDTVNGMTPDEARQRVRFEDLTPLFPDQTLRLEVPGDSNNMVARIVDLISPIGKGQRGLIVSPPKAGKTTVLKQIAHSIEANNPETHLIVLLVDERPEEVTDMRRSVKGEVVSSTFDRPSDEHTQVAELTLERAKRLVELGKDVVIVLDGITRLARAYNLAAPATGRIMSGGIDTGALYPPKKFFGAARNIEEGGSLTILATALVETGSKMDEVIFEEFKGTGNMELRLDRRLAERRIYPALDVNASSTRHEELLFDRSQLQQVWKLRRVLNALEGGAGLELLMDKIKTTKSNDEFLSEIAKAPTPAA
jgi:transcription termination factor Rho